MAWQRSRPKSARFVPAVEDLEARMAPAVKIIPAPDGQAVRIIGDPEQGDAIRILDNGSAKPKAIKVYELLGGKVTPNGALGGPTQLLAALPGTFKNIFVSTGGGRDRVEYHSSFANFATTRLVIVWLGKDKDNFFGNLVGTTFHPSSALTLGVFAGDGDDSLQTQLAGLRVASSAVLGLVFGGEAGKDFVNCGSIMAQGGTNPLPLWGSTADPKSLVYLWMDGGTEDDQLQAWGWDWKMDGAFGVVGLGQGGQDWMTFKFSFSDKSTGALQVRLDGGPDNDAINLIIEPPSFIPAVAEVHGGPGTNSCFTTSVITATSGC